MSVFKKKITNSSLAPLSSVRLWHKRSLLWILTAVLCILLKEVLPTSIWEKGYYQGLFTWIRVVYDYTLGWSFIPMVYIVVAILLFRTTIWLRQWHKGLVYQLTRAIGGMALIITIFYVFWGFNYGQISLSQRAGFDFEQVSNSDIEMEFRRATIALKKEAEALPTSLTSDEVINSFKIEDNHLRSDVEAALAELNLIHVGRVRVRQLWPKGILLRLNTAGIYIPHTGEGHIDRGLLSVQKPFTIAHEMAHGYGVADEGSCNFIAWLACSISEDPWIRFGGAFTYWRYAAAEMPVDSLSQVIHEFPAVVRRAITLIKENDKKYPDIMPRARDAIYSSYLKKHGVKGGLRSYNEVVMMVQQYQEKKLSAVPDK
jgi:hypothetical protein